MSVERTARGRWRARWRDGAGRARSKTFDRKADATAFLRRALDERERGPDGDGSIRLTDWARMWLEASRHLGPGGRDIYWSTLNRHILPELGGGRLDRLTAEDIDRYLTMKSQTLAPATVHRHYRTLRTMLGAAVDRGRLVRNPCDVVKPPKVERTEMRFLSVSEIDRLADAITPQRYRALIYVLAYGGLRWSEAMSLTYGDFDRRAGALTVDSQRVRLNAGEWEERAPKTRASRRRVTLPRSITDILSRHCLLFGVHRREQRIFTTSTGETPSASSWTGGHFKPALVRAGLDPKTRIHDLRHTAAALAIAAGAHPKAIQARLGHSTVGMSLDQYGHLYPDVDEALADKLEALRHPTAEDNG